MWYDRKGKRTKEVGNNKCKREKKTKQVWEISSYNNFRKTLNKYKKIKYERRKSARNGHIAEIEKNMRNNKNSEKYKQISNTCRDFWPRVGNL